ncbi:hypothetical protein DQK91_22780 [Oceanidesulfovibrio marinus]|uniref:Uncharacterized protein n=1 Tax=Oceanidesulfovibrio marinus TaxID=370038 RepID=A0A6P1ZAG5_9BACT|nr:hypothetical protein DQK91_22780 [Oceanidesulfovibrio marinus]
MGYVPDCGLPPLATVKGKPHFIMQKHGYGHIYGPERIEGPFSEHSEPVDTPVGRHPFSTQLHNPCSKSVGSDMDVLAAPADPRYPVVLTPYSVPEHCCGGRETRNVTNLRKT